MTSMDEVMMRMRASVMATPVRPAMVVNMTMVGFCSKSWLSELGGFLPVYMLIIIFETQISPQTGSHR